jgi:signal transduction histidine kinase
MIHGFPMTLHEITPKQLRALLLLLVLVPFIPMVLMLRFMTDALESERDAAWERIVTTNHRALLNAAATLQKRVAAQATSSVQTAPPAQTATSVPSTPTEPDDLRRYFREVFEPTIEVAIIDATGRVVAGPTLSTGRLITRTRFDRRGELWTVQIYLVNQAPLRQAVREQFKVYAWTALVLSVAICAIAAAAGMTVHRQLRLNELKNNAVATVAHELRTPLATMRMLVDTLREGRYRSDAQLHEYLELINTENLRLSRLTEHFLNHTRLTHALYDFNFTAVSLRTIAEAAITPLRARLDAPDCTFTLELTEPLPEIIADHHGLVTVVINLLENALKYTNEIKRITLRARGDQQSAVLVVEDNGVGLTSAERKHIFEPFYQADRKLSRIREGSGLGLSIVQAIVEAHRGRIEVVSQPGSGSSFTVTLPLIPA